MKSVIVVVAVLAVTFFVSALPEDEDEIKDEVKKMGRPDKMCNSPAGGMTSANPELPTGKSGHHMHQVNGNEMKGKLPKGHKQKRSPQVIDYFQTVKDKVIGRKKRGADHEHSSSPTSESPTESKTASQEPILASTAH